METDDDLNITQSLDRKLRLKVLMDEGQKLDNVLSNYESTDALKNICDIIKTSDEIINEGKVEDRAQHTTEVVMDAHVLKINHELVSKVLNHNMEFNEQLYRNSIKSIVYKGTTPDWNNLAELVCTTARTLNLHSSMLGAVTAEYKAPVARQRQQRTRKELGEEKRPETVKMLKRQDKGAEKVNIVHRQLAKIFRDNHVDSMPFYKLIVDPQNFMNTVENAFQLAFLARDGVISIAKGSDGHPTVSLVPSADNKIQMDTTQGICSLDMAKCAKMARIYKIKAPLLKIELENMEVDEEERTDSDED